MKRKMWRLLLLIVFWSVSFFPSYANEEEEITKGAQELMGQINTDEIDQMLKEIFPERTVRFSDLMKEIFSGDLNQGWKTAGRFLKEQVFYQFQSQKAGMLHLLLIAMVAAVFSNFSSIFKNRQVADLSFFILYLFLMIICLNAFSVLTDMAGERLGILTDFMKVLGPVYMMTVGMAKGAGSALSFYSLILLVIFLIELIILNFLLPLIHVWIMVQILNFLSPEEYFSKFGELIEMIISWILKTLLAGVIGLNMIQGLLHPALDAIKRGALTKTIQVIPGVGDVIGGAGNILVGTAILIKNGIGVCGAVVCMAIVLFPLLEMACYAFLYRCIAALVQPVSDTRIVGCISSMAKGCQMMMRIVFTTGILFLLTIAIIAATTS